MAEVQAKDENGLFLTVQPIYNNFDYDAFFLTITVLSHRQYPKEMSNTEFIGAMAIFEVTDLSG